MKTTENLKMAQVVSSKLGRDKGKVFLIFEVVDDQYVLIVDGYFHKVEKPKRKKVKHLQKYNVVLDDIALDLYNKNISNADVRKTLEPYKK